MVKVVVRQDDMTDLVACHASHILVDRLRLGQRRAAVDQHGSCSATDDAHGDVEKRQPAAEHTVAEPLPREVHCPSVNGWAARYWSSTSGVGSAV